MKIFQIMVVLASVSVAHAELPPTAKSLPAINVLCFRSFVASTVKQVPGVAIDGEIEAGYRDTPRFKLMTVNGEVLKVITSPSMPAYRNEYGKSRFEINVSMIVDPAKRPPIFAWKWIRTFMRLEQTTDSFRSPVPFTLGEVVRRQKC